MSQSHMILMAYGEFGQLKVCKEPFRVVSLRSPPPQCGSCKVGTEVVAGCDVVDDPKVAARGDVVDGTEVVAGGDVVVRGATVIDLYCALNPCLVGPCDDLDSNRTVSLLELVLMGSGLVR